MGFDAPSGPRLRLEFDDAGYAGLVVICREPSLGAYLDLVGLAGASTMDGVRHALEQFGNDVLAEWNVTKDGDPVPATAEGLLSLDRSFARAIFNAWQANVVRVPGPLESQPNDGAMSAEASIPMVTLSGNHTS